MDMHMIEAFFYTAQDARRAMNALQAENFTVEEPEPLTQPNNGRQWLLEIGMPNYSGMAPRYTDPNVTGQIDGIVLRFNGTLETVGE